MHEKFIHAWRKMLEKLENWFDALVVGLPNLIIASIVFLTVLLLSKYLHKFVLRILERSKLQISMKNLIAQLTSTVVILFGLFLVLGILNLSKALNTVLAGAGVVGLAVGLALQGALANFYSGVILSYVHFLKFGDWVETNGFEGQVVDIDLRSVTLKQADNNLVYMPNKMVVENPIKNYSTTAQSTVILSCGVHYDSDLRFVERLVVKTIVEEFKAVERDESVMFLFTEFADSSINFEVRFSIKSTSAIEVARAKSKAIIAIKAVFDAKGIIIPFPIRTLDFPKDFSLGANTKPSES